MRIRLFAIGAVLTLSCLSAVIAATPPPNLPPGPTSPTVGCSIQPAVDRVAVIRPADERRKHRRLGVAGQPDDRKVHLGDSIVVLVLCLEDYVKKLPGDADSGLVLFLNG